MLCTARQALCACATSNCSRAGRVTARVSAMYVLGCSSVLALMVTIGCRASMGSHVAFTPCGASPPGLEPFTGPELATFTAVEPTLYPLAAEAWAGSRISLTFDASVDVRLEDIFLLLRVFVPFFGGANHILYATHVFSIGAPAAAATRAREVSIRGRQLNASVWYFVPAAARLVPSAIIQLNDGRRDQPCGSRYEVPDRCIELSTAD